jgi:Protein of unknown function (DUF3455)
MFWKTTALIVTLAIAPNAAAQDVTPVPANLKVPEGHSPYLMAHAEGTQNYVCVPTSAGHTWTFFGPQATLFNGGQQVTTHFLSPNPDPAESGTPRATWQHSGDTSTVWAAAIANSTDSSFVAAGAIPWLLLQVVGSEVVGGTLTDTKYIQRVNTAGGIAPATGCKSAKDTGKKALVPYSTDYVFYR